MSAGGPTRGTGRAAIARLYEDTGAFVFRRCFQMLRDRDEAMDATQYAYLRAIETGFEVRGTAEALSWLYRTATRRCLWVLRNQRHRAGLLERHGRDVFDVPVDTPEAALIGRDLLERALALVDDATAEIVLLSYVVGFPTERTAELCGVSLRTVTRARAAFQDAVAKVQPTEEAS